jgi:hypothetical protein
MYAGKAEVASFDSLQAFWPALQVLAGDVAAAAQTQEAFHRCDGRGVPRSATACH